MILAEAQKDWIYSIASFFLNDKDYKLVKFPLLKPKTLISTVNMRKQISNVSGMLSYSFLIRLHEVIETFNYSLPFDLIMLNANVVYEAIISCVI